MSRIRTRHANWLALGTASLLALGVGSAPSAATATAGPAHVAIKTARASSSLKGYSAGGAIDGDIGEDSSRWVSDRVPGPHWLELELASPTKIAGAHVYTGWGERDAVHDFELQSWDGSAWQPIAGTAVHRNDKTSLTLRFDAPVETSKVRLYSTDADIVRVKEVILWPAGDAALPPLGAGLNGGALTPDLGVHHALVNQIGYNADWPKRFTAPISPDGADFQVIDVATGRAAFEGKVTGGVGDFSALRTADADHEYRIHVTSGDLKPGESFPFHIAPMLLERSTLEQALHFMVDSRSLVATHPSAYGGCPWRDGAYYTFEVPSLVMLYLADPDYFESLPPEIDRAREAAKVSSESFKWKREPNDARALDTVRRYYRELDPPVGDRVPDLVQLLHWGIGYYLLNPATHDPSGDPAGEKVHAQTVEQFAYFLYAYPHLSRYFTPAFYQRARDFAFEQWGRTGLLGVITQVGDAKGRDCPGHSVMPNLLMYEVAKRESRPEAKQYLDAAVAQAQWVVTTFDPADPRVGRGQRMSEHKLLPGLAMLLRDYPKAAPGGLADWIERWAQNEIARSDNAYDFPRIDARDWTVPQPFNDLGSTAAFPAIALAAESAVQSPATRDRLRQIAAAQFDELFGRNPMNAACTGDVKAYPGLDQRWPRAFSKDVCARLELCRGTLNAIPGSENFPFAPQAGFRHSEGWTAFNAAFNVSQAYACRADTRVELLNESGEPIDAARPDQSVRLHLRAFAGGKAHLWADGGVAIELTPRPQSPIDFDATMKLGDLTKDTASPLTLHYGYGFLGRSLTLTFDAASGTWRLERGARP